MGVGAAHGVQLAAVRLHHHGPGGPGAGGDVPQGLVRLPLLEVDLVDGGAGAQGLDDGVAALDEAVGLRRQGVFLLIVHGYPPESGRPAPAGSGIPLQYTITHALRKEDSQKIYQNSMACPCLYRRSVL